MARRHTGSQHSSLERGKAGGSGAVDGAQGTQLRSEVEPQADAGGISGRCAGTVGAQQEAAAGRWAVAWAIVHLLEC